MTRTADTTIKLSFGSTIKNTLADGSVASLKVGQSVLNSRLASGIEAGQSNRAWSETDITISSGATLDIDLYDYAGRDIGAGVGRDALGQVLTVEEIVCLAIKMTAGPGQLEIMPTAPANAVAFIPAGLATVANGGALKANGIRMWYQDAVDAFDITDASSNLLRLGANGGAVTFDILVAGRHDDNESSSSSQSTSSQSTSSSSSSSSSSPSISSLTTSSQSSSSTSSLSSQSSSSSSVSSLSSTSTLSSLSTTTT